MTSNFGNSSTSNKSSNNSMIACRSDFTVARLVTLSQLVVLLLLLVLIATTEPIEATSRLGSVRDVLSLVGTGKRSSSITAGSARLKLSRTTKELVFLRGGATSSSSSSSSSSTSRNESKSGRNKHLILAYTENTTTRSTLARRSTLPFVHPRYSVIGTSSSLSHAIRGGDGPLGTTAVALQQVLEAPPTPLEPTKTTTKRTLWTAVACTFIYTLVLQRHVWVPLLTNKQALQDATLSVLQSLTPATTDPPSDWLRAYVTYGLGMAGWELCGLSTIPVETAAGMVFGFGPAAAASLTGKLCGASLAFALGRTRAVRERIVAHSAVQQSTLLQQLLFLHSNNDNNDNNNNSNNRPAPHPPLVTAFLMKFSCFPELIKNLGSSLIPVVEPWMFGLVTLLHGGTFTLVWTWLGSDTAARLQQPLLPSNRALQATVVATLVLGIVVTPLVMIWWVRDLQRQATPITTTTTTTTSTNTENRPWHAQWQNMKFFSRPHLGAEKSSLVEHRHHRQQQRKQQQDASSSLSHQLQNMLRQWKYQVRMYARDTSIAEVCMVGLLCTLLVVTGRIYE